jgi:hypothetical protein
LIDNNFFDVIADLDSSFKVPAPLWLQQRIFNSSITILAITTLKPVYFCKDMSRGLRD